MVVSTISLFSPPIPEGKIHFDEYFSNGLVQPPTSLACRFFLEKKASGDQNPSPTARNFCLNFFWGLFWDLPKSMGSWKGHNLLMTRNSAERKGIIMKERGMAILPKVNFYCFEAFFFPNSLALVSSAIVKGLGRKWHVGFCGVLCRKWLSPGKKSERECSPNCSVHWSSNSQLGPQM